MCNSSDPFGLCPPKDKNTSDCSAEVKRLMSSDRPLERQGGSVDKIAFVLGLADGLSEGAGAIEISGATLRHVIERHGAGSLATGTSKFAEGEDIVSLIHSAASTERSAARYPGTYQRIVTAGREIGTDLEGAATRVYTVITDELNKLITTHPGVPKP